MSTVASPNMALPVPVVGDEPGPQYAIDINACLAILDAHDHTTGSGVPITPSAMNINSDLSVGANNLTDLRSARFVPQGAPLALAADLGCIYVTGVDLYYNDVNGNQIQITDNGGVAGTPGSIANLTSPASASYVALSETFVWQSNANTAASMDMRSAILRNGTANSFGLTLSAPTLAADATQILPQVPAATAFMTMDAAGSMGTSIPIALGIDNSMMADNSIELRNMTDDSVGTDELIDESVTYEKRAAINTVASSSSGSFSTTSSSQTLVVSASITTTGKPVMVSIESASPSSGAEITIIDGSNPPIAVMYYTRDTTDIAKEQFPSTLIGAQNTLCGMHTFIDTDIVGTPGTYVYKLQANVISSPTSVLSITNMRLRVYEL